MLEEFFNDNNITDSNTKNQLILDTHRFIKKYLKKKNRFGISNFKNSQFSDRYNPIQEKISHKIIEFALNNSLYDHNYRSWIKNSSSDQIENDIKNKNSELGKLLKTQKNRYGLSSSSSNFNNNQLLFLLDLKQLFLNDNQFYEFLQSNYPNELELYKFQLFPSFNKNIISNKTITSSYRNLSEPKTVNRVHTYEPMTSSLLAKYNPETLEKNTRSIINRSRNPHVTVASEYLGSKPIRKYNQLSSLIQSRPSEIKSRYRPVKRDVLTKYASASALNLRSNRYGLKPKVIKRSINHTPKLQTLSTILEQKVKPRRVYSVSRLHPMKHQVHSVVRRSIENQGFGDYSVLK